MRWYLYLKLSPLLNVCPAGVEKVVDDVCAAVPAGQEERSASFGSLLAGDLAAVLSTELFHLPPKLVGKPIPRSGKLAFGDQISKQVQLVAAPIRQYPHLFSLFFSLLFLVWFVFLLFTDSMIYKSLSLLLGLSFRDSQGGTQLF